MAAEQTLMEGVATDLMKSAQTFVETRNEILHIKNQAKMQLADLEEKLKQEKEKILIEMKKENRDIYTFNPGNGATKAYQFSIEHNEDDLKCVETTPLPLTDTVLEQ